MTSEEYGQYIDDFEMGIDVGPDETLTQYIERRRREFDSKADGGSIGIEVLFGPKVPAAPSQLVSESDIILGYRGDAAYRSASEQSKSIGQGNVGSKASFGGGKGVDRSGRDEGAGGADRSKITQEQTINQIRNQLGIKDPNLIQKTFQKYNTLPFGVKTAINTMAPVELMKLFNIGNAINTGINQMKNPDFTEEDVTLGIDNLRADLTKSQKKALGKQKMGYDMGLFTIDDVRENIKPLGDPDKPATNEEIKEFFQAKDGGRVGLFMGGPALEGQALNIYNSMNAYGFTDQEIADALSARGLYTPAGSGSGTETTQPNIINQQLQTGGGGGGITELQKTFTTETAPPSKPYTVTNFPEFDEYSVAKDFYETKQLPSYTYDKMGGLKITPDVRKDMTEYYADETSVGNYPVPEKDTSFIGSALDKFGSLKDKFFAPKVKGTLGTRLANQPRIPLPGAIASYALSPFNPDSRNFNPLLEGQLNFLELGDNLIGRDPGTGGLKYGSGSVLSGKNVISGFGSNNYEVALNKYIQRMNRYEKPTKFQQQKIEQAKQELKALQEKQAQDMRARQADTTRRARELNPDVYARAEQLGFIDKNTGGFKSTGTNEAFSNKTGRGRTGYGDGGLATMFTRRR